jgi:cell division septation protein DedD
LNSLLDDNTDLPDERERDGTRQDREISLGTTMLLGIFFALCLLCAVFFFFGYSLGRSSAQNAGVAQSASGRFSSGSKPTAGRSSLDPVVPDAGDKPPAVTSLPYVAPPPSRPVAAAANDASGEKNAQPVPITRVTPATGLASPAATQIASAPVATVVPGTGTAMVQVAAVTHQEDADYLVSALKRRGYAVAIHTEPQDKYLHVQVGPFASKKDAEAMRQKLLADGFNAIVK